LPEFSIGKMSAENSRRKFRNAETGKCRENKTPSRQPLRHESHAVAHRHAMHKWKRLSVLLAKTAE